MADAIYEQLSCWLDLVMERWSRSAQDDICLAVLVKVVIWITIERIQDNKLGLSSAELDSFRLD